MAKYVVASAAVAWLLAWGVLGTEWQGRVDATGRWVDAVSLGQWALFWALLTGVGLVVGHRLHGALARALPVVPTLAFLALQLWGSALGPLPIVIYSAPTLAAWYAGVALGARRHAAVARSVKP